jgi:hypothetical protein
MRGDRHRECHPVDGGRFNRFANPGPYCPVGDVPDAAFSVLPVRLLRLSSGIFRVATIICSWLT